MPCRFSLAAHVLTLCALSVDGVSTQFSAYPPPLPELAGDWVDTRMCASDAASAREVCSGPGITQQSCYDLGCCWDDSNASLPWCFLPNAPADYQASTWQAYGSNQAIPSTMSLRGGVQASFDGDVAAVSCAILPPYVGTCDYDYGAATQAYNFPANFSVNGRRPRALPRFQWTPYGHRRMASDTTGVQLQSEVRMLHSEAGILVQLSVGSLAVGSTATVSAYLPLLIRDFSSSTWGWDAPTADSNLSHFRHSLVPWPSAMAAPVPVPRQALDDGNGVILSLDTLSDAAAAASVWTDAQVSNCSLSLSPLGTGSAGFVTWRFTVTSNTPIHFGFLLYIGRNATNVTAAAAQLGGSEFPTTWARAQSETDALWSAVFAGNGSSSGNGTSDGSAFFSGSLPIVRPSSGSSSNNTVTGAMATMYYTSVLSLLQNVKYPPLFASDSAPRNSSGQYPFGQWTVPSAAPSKAVSTIYLWDTAYASPILARLEPVGYLSIVQALLEADLHSSYAVDTVSLQPVGRWYSFNDYSVHVLLTSYAKYAVPQGDELQFWDSEIAGRRAIDWLDASAVWWQSLPRIPTGTNGTSGGVSLVDYGLAPNLLECVPTYQHAVPALHAANVWMMNTTAAIWRALGNSSRADELQSMSSALLPLVLDLYTRDNATNAGLGYFSCLYPDGERVPVQHVIDFLTIADTIGPLLPPAMQAEMVAFMQGSLLTSQWMRALSLTDPAAPRSDRADHGPFGAYDSWPAKTIDGLWTMGYTTEAVALFDRFMPVVSEGPLGQSHRVYNNPLLPQLQTGKSAVDQQYAASNTASFAAAVLRIAGL